MAGLLIDTDILIDHLRGARPFTPPNRRVAYSVVTRCELFAGKRADEAGIRSLLGAMTELHIDRAIAECAGRLRRRSGLRTPDALIAATALEHDLSLMSRNLRDFAGVEGLQVVAADLHE